MARGIGGIGALVKAHNNRRHDWNRFSGFSLDDNYEAGNEWSGCSAVVPRDVLEDMSAEAVLKECEALFISILGLTHQNKMRFQGAQEWRQLTGSAFLLHDVSRKAARSGFTDEFFIERYDGFE